MKKSNSCPGRRAGIFIECCILICCVFVFAQDVYDTDSTDMGDDYRYQKWSWYHADIRSVFNELSNIGGVDIVIASGVNGKVTMTLTDKTWKEVFEIVCKLLNLAAVKEEGYIFVLNGDEYRKRQLENATDEQEVAKLSPLVREVIKLDNMTAGDMQASIKELLSDRGKITVVTHNNSLIVYDTEENIRQIKSMIKKLDLETEQISISAKIIEVSSGVINNLGIQWGVMGDIAGAEAGAMHLPGTDVIQGALEQVFYGILPTNNVSVLMEMLFSENKGEIVAQPQITTLDNSEAKIFMGKQVPITYQDFSGNTLVKMVDAGTELTVTPHITGKGRIKLKLDPKKKSYELTGEGVPIISEQSAMTNVVVNDGETVVIAGLTSNELLESEGGIPVLKDIPLIGNLFKRSQKSRDKKDLIIFVTPHIIKKSIDRAVSSVQDTSSMAEDFSK